MNANLTDTMPLPASAPPSGAMGVEPRVAANHEPALFGLEFDLLLTSSARADDGASLRAGITGEGSPVPRFSREFEDKDAVEGIGWSSSAHLLSAAVTGDPTASLISDRAGRVLPVADAFHTPMNRPAALALLREDGLAAILDGENAVSSPDLWRLSTGSVRLAMMPAGSRDAAGIRVMAPWGVPVPTQSSDAPADAATGSPARARIDFFRQFVSGPDVETANVPDVSKPQPMALLHAGNSLRPTSDSISDRTIERRVQPHGNSVAQVVIGRVASVEVESRGGIPLPLSGDSAQPQSTDGATRTRMASAQAEADLAETTRRVQVLRSAEASMAPSRIPVGEGQSKSLVAVKLSAGENVPLAGEGSQSTQKSRTPHVSTNEREPTPNPQREVTAAVGSVRIVSGQTATAAATQTIPEALRESMVRLPRAAVRTQRDPAGSVKPQAVASSANTGMAQSASPVPGQELVEAVDSYSGFVSARPGNGPKLSANAAVVNPAGKTVTLRQPSVEISPLAHVTETVLPHRLEGMKQAAGDSPEVERIERFIIESPKPNAPPNRLVVQLEPPHLGRLRIALSSHNGKVTGRLRFDTEAARALMHKSLPELHRTLAAAGIRIERLEVAGPIAPRDGAAFVTTQDGEQQSLPERQKWQETARGDDPPHPSSPDHLDTADPQRPRPVAGLYRAALIAGHVDFVI